MPDGSLMSISRGSGDASDLDRYILATLNKLDLLVMRCVPHNCGPKYEIPCHCPVI